MAKPRGKPFTSNDPRRSLAGRPKGTKNKIRWSNLQDLQDLALDALKEIDDPHAILAYVKHKELLLIPKLTSAPKTPEESVENAKAQDVDKEIADAEK